MPVRGRPKGTPTKSWADAVRKAANDIDKDKKKRKLELLAGSLVAKGIDGDVSALKEIGDRIDGKVPQALIGGQKGEPPIAFQLVELCPVYPRETKD